MTLVGYCMGGVLSTIYAALHADGPVKNLVCFTTPIDCTKMTLFQSMADQRHFDVDRLVDTLGNVPPDMVIGAFDALRPAGRVAAQVRLWDNMWNDEYVKGYRMMDRWGAETLPLAGEYFRQTVKELMLEERACTKARCASAAGRSTSSNIKVPLLHVIAQYDHIVPPECAQPLVQRVRLARQGRTRCCRAATSAWWPGPMPSSACGPHSINGWESDPT